MKVDPTKTMVDLIEHLVGGVTIESVTPASPKVAPAPEPRPPESAGRESEESDAPLSDESR